MTEKQQQNWQLELSGLNPADPDTWGFIQEVKDSVEKAGQPRTQDAKPEYYCRACDTFGDLHDHSQAARIVIMAHDQPGVIADLAQALADAGINILSLNTGNAGEQSIITLITNDTDQALQALANTGFKATTDNSLIIRIPDEAGSLAPGLPGSSRKQE